MARDVWFMMTVAFGVLAIVVAIAVSMLFRLPLP
jgi:hypothetical protein